MNLFRNLALLLEALEEALRKDVAGNADGTSVRVGRFEAFVGVVVSLASKAIAEKMDSLKRNVEHCAKSTLRKAAFPTYNLKARHGRRSFSLLFFWTREPFCWRGVSCLYLTDQSEREPEIP